MASRKSVIHVSSFVSDSQLCNMRMRQDRYRDCSVVILSRLGTADLERLRPSLTLDGCPGPPAVSSALYSSRNLMKTLRAHERRRVGERATAADPLTACRR